MANHKSAKKRIRSSERRRVMNRTALSKVKTMQGKVFNTTEKDKAEEYLKETVAALDKAAVKGRIHKNNVARKKAKLTSYVNGLGAEKAAEKE